MKNKNYKILVLLDVFKFEVIMLNVSVSFVKIIGGEIDFLYVKRFIEIVEKEN